MLKKLHARMLRIDKYVNMLLIALGYVALGAMHVFRLFLVFMWAILRVK